jgi:hypothetical protein
MLNFLICEAIVKQIELTKGQVALVDDDDFDEINKYEWHATYQAKTKSFYAARTAPRGEVPRRIYMHRQIMNAKPGEEVDHKSHATLDNRRDNLRIATSAQNKANRKGLPSHNSSGYCGVSWDKRRQKWAAYISLGNRKLNLGRYDSKHDAARAYNEAAIKHRGEFATLNIIDNEFAMSA